MPTYPWDQNDFGPTLRRWPEGEQRAQELELRLPAFEVWRSLDFLVQMFREDGVVRMTVNRTHTSESDDDWAGEISWEELQALKHEIGRGSSWAVELYPPDDAVVNTASMRHLWLLDEPPPYGWH